MLDLATHAAPEARRRRARRPRSCSRSSRPTVSASPTCARTISTSRTLTGGAITRLTSDGSRTIINGTFDWVYEEELSLRDGFRWSPDGKSIAYWQLDASGVKDYALIDDTDSLYSFVNPVQYPKAGTTNSAGRIGVVAATGGDDDVARDRWRSAQPVSRAHGLGGARQLERAAHPAHESTAERDRRPARRRAHRRREDRFSSSATRRGWTS